MNYNPQKIEKKWQRYWEKNKFYQAKNFSKKPKIYLLVEFPYPSGDGLHVGHCRSYTALDVLARKKRMEGFNVLFPMGWDAFGLPTENYAIKTGIHPKIVTKKNTANFKKQEKRLGFSFDWTREINTTDSGYYKWTQWIFLELFKRGLAYKAKMPINWCPACKTGLANEEVINGYCERCGEKVERREKEQWLLKITKYAERLIKDLDLVNYPEKVKILQKEWIGKSEGTIIKFPIFNTQFLIDVFTTRVDTIFGCTYLVMAPEHPFVNSLFTSQKKSFKELAGKIKNIKEVEDYIKKAKEKSEIERISAEKEKTGKELKGIKAINPFNNEKIPIFIADYVLASYATGAIMAVPAHDERDFVFAKKYNLPIIEVIKPETSKKNKYFLGQKRELGIEKKVFVDYGILVNSGCFSGLKSREAIEKMTKWLEKKKRGKRAVYYKLRDWIFSRQHYWGEPIPLIFCKNCAVKIKREKAKVKNEFNKGELLNPGWVAVLEKDLPLELPNVKKYKPTETGESPLAGVKDWVNTKCPKCGNWAKRETDTMPNWAGSNWYFLRYCDPKNNKELANKKLLEYWMPVDWYDGGMEHTTLHLLYSRFIYKFLWDIGVVPKICGPEPYRKRTCHGIVLGEGGIKMSKSKGNVINPDDVIKEYGADTLRLYELFMGPFGETIAWDPKGIRGVRRFLEKVWKLSNSFIGINQSKLVKIKGLKKILHRTIKKVSEDIEAMKFNTAISSMMEFCNEWQKNPWQIEKEDFSNFLKILSPFAPHLTEELWQKLGREKSIFLEKWPRYDQKLIKEKTISLIIQVNGRVRDKIETVSGISQKDAERLAMESKKIKKWIKGKSVKKIIFVKDKLINIVI